MTKPKKILAWSIKILIGIISFYIIYSKLSSIPHLKEQCIHWFNDPSMYLTLLFVLLLMPVNWGIEIFKWQLTTRQVEQVTYSTAFKSVFSGICVGNIAPGRAMEFLAKIVFFKIENRPSITILHFINGMFQMLITVLIGITAIAYKLSTGQQSSSLIYMILIGGALLMLVFCWAILNVDFIQKKLRFIKWFSKMNEAKNIRFSKKLISRLISLSMIRYLVFTTQFYLIYHSLCPETQLHFAFMSIAAYFMLTSIIPMISLIEPAIRAAIAIFVFNNPTDNAVSVVLASTFVWVINVVIPSLIGYIIIFKEKIEFRPARAN